MPEVEISANVSATATSSCALNSLSALAATAIAVATASAEINANYNLPSSTLQVNTTASLNLTNQNNNLIAQANVGSEASLSLSSDKTIGASISTYTNASLNLGGDIQLTPKPITITATATASFGRDHTGVCDVLREVFLLWGIENPCLALEWTRGRALADLNAAMQILWSQSAEVNYWTRSTLTLDFDTNQESKVLQNNIQNIVGPVRINRCALAPLQSRGELENYSTYYLGEYSNDDSDVAPQAYYAERTNQGGIEPCRVTLHLAPKPKNITTLEVDVVLECPRFTWKDFQKCTAIPIPHQYVESILMPIIRHRASSFHLFIKPERMELINNERAQAFAQLGLNDPLAGKEEAND